MFERVGDLWKKYMRRYTMRKVTIFVTAIALLGLAGNASAGLSDGLVGQWGYDGATGLEATVGSDLTLTGTQTSVAGIVAGDGAYEFGNGDYYTVDNTGGPANTYTLLLDFKVISMPSYNSLLDTGTGGDGDVFLRYDSPSVVGGSARLGGYSGNIVTHGTWYRMVLRIDMNAATLAGAIDLDGINVLTCDGSSYPNQMDLQTAFDLFSDNGGGEEGDTVVSNAALWDRYLTDDEVSTLGGAGDAIPEPATLVLLGIGGIGALLRKRRA